MPPAFQRGRQATRNTVDQVKLARVGLILIIANEIRGLAVALIAAHTMGWL